MITAGHVVVAGVFAADGAAIERLTTFGRVFAAAGVAMEFAAVGRVLAAGDIERLENRWPFQCRWCCVPLDPAGRGVAGCVAKSAWRPFAGDVAGGVVWGPELRWPLKLLMALFWKRSLLAATVAVMLLGRANLPLVVLLLPVVL